MRFMRLGIWLVVAMLAASGVAHAQSTTGTISGRVVDAQERTVPGVTVSVESANLQGIRTAVTSENGDYIFTLLPSGQYTITFELSGFERQQRTVSVAPTQVVPIDVTMGLAGVAETVEVVGRAADVLTQTAQVATNFSQELIATLPTNRDINASLLLAPSVHPTGPSGDYSIAGSMSYENLFMINGVTVNENLRGQAFNLYIEDAIQETTIATAGVSAEYGRFGGGVVNMITKSGGNKFSGSFRDTLNNDNWRTLVPQAHRRPLRERHEARQDRADLRIHVRRADHAGPSVVLHRGPLPEQQLSRQPRADEYPVHRRRTIRSATSSTAPIPRRRTIGSRPPTSRKASIRLNNTFSTAASMDLRSLEDRSQPQDLFTINYSGILTPTFFIEGRYSQRNFTLHRIGLQVDRHHRRHAAARPAPRQSLRYWSPTFCGVCTDEERDNQDIYRQRRRTSCRRAATARTT